MIGIRTTRHRGALRRLGTLTASAALAVAGLAAPSAPAHADNGDLTCTGSGAAHFTPPLTASNTTASAEGSAQLVNCVSPNGDYPQLESASIAGTGEATTPGGQPCPALVTATGAATITWFPTGETSEIDFTVNTDPTGGGVTISAQIVAGPLTGDTITGAPAEANPNPDCPFAGLKSLSVAAGQLVFG